MEGGSTASFKCRRICQITSWQQQAYSMMLVIRTSDATIRWMSVTEYLQKQGRKQVRQVVFRGEPFTAQALR